jgi:acyl-CoA thioester hydrolase
MNCFEMTYRVPYAETDQMGVVYYANYLVYFERHRTEMLRSIGLPYLELEKQGVFLPVIEAHIDYKMPARYDNLLTFRGWTIEARGVRVKMACEVYRDETLLCSGYVVLACCNPEGRPMRIPAELKNACEQISGLESE